MNAREVIRLGISRLRDAAEIKNANLDVRMLLAFAMGIGSSDIFFHMDRAISPEVAERFFDLIDRRAKREAVSTIIGQKPFWNRNFVVDKNVLAPRPDSETLIEAIICEYGEKSPPKNILELGVGSGCLIITLLDLFDSAGGIGIDISDRALAIAKENRSLAGMDGRLQLRRGNWNDGLDGKFDLIISNPPYIPKASIDGLMDEVRLHEPRLALDGGDDGLDCYRYIGANIGRNLAYGGLIFLEIGEGQEGDVAEIFADNGFQLMGEYKDLGGRIRVLGFSLCNDGG